MLFIFTRLQGRSTISNERRIDRIRRFASNWSKTTLSIQQNEFIRDIPYNRGLPIVGTSFSIGAAGGAPKLHQYVDSRHKSLGPIFRENMGSTTAIFISDPSIIRRIFLYEGKHPKHFVPKSWSLYNEIHRCKRGLFFMEGDEWYNNRRIMNKHFLSPVLIDGLKNVHEAIVSDLIQRWKRFSGGQVDNLEFEFYRHSISFVLGSLIGDVYMKKMNEYEEHVVKMAKTFQQIFETSSKLNVLPNVRLLQIFGHGLWKRFESSVTTSLETSRDVVSKALSSHSENGLLYKLTKENLNKEDILALVTDLLIAAGDTTAFTTQWAVYHLGKDSDVQENVREEMAKIKGVVRESLRLYPSAPFIARILPKEENVEGYILRQGVSADMLSAEELVLLSLYTAGRNGNLYPNPEQFLPDRWEKDVNSSKFRGVVDNKGFLPFALGARSCIGARLAMTQMTLTINQLIQNYRLLVNEEVDMVLRLVPVPSKPFGLRLENLT